MCHCRQPYNCLLHWTEWEHKVTVGENGPPQRGPWWFSGCLYLDSGLDLSFPHWGLGNHGVACRVVVGRRHCACEAWTVSERCVTPRQSHGGTISSAESLAVLFLIPHLLASPRTVFCQGLAWFTEKRSSAGTQAFPFLPKRLFCRSKAAPWRCISLIYALAESVWERYFLHWGGWWWRGRWDRERSIRCFQKGTPVGLWMCVTCVPSAFCEQG